ncbi:FecCD family ABC transporter permease [Silvanigrella sp.]|uniref:FecCD family ABC transporter permease n=1 Tax=Silvanigrella sp. TaxID=2024976 RepID=UPI0037CBE2F3
MNSIFKHNLSNTKVVLNIFFLSFLLALFFILGNIFGDVKVHLDFTFPHIFYNLKNNIIVYEYRLPRTLVAICVGVNFSLAGCILQSITRNSLAAPNIIGINSGASFFSVLSLFVLTQSLFFILPVAAFFGAIFSCILVYLISYKNGINPFRLILTGIAIDILFQAGTSFILIHNSLEVGSAFMWLSGSLWGKTWGDFYFILPFTIIGCFVTFLFSHKLKAFHLNEELIIGIGINANKNRVILLFISAFLSASGVCIVGPIGFIGLIVPHLVKILVGYQYKIVIIYSGLIGAILVVFSDMMGRTIFAPFEIPAGIIASLIGSPYFIYLLIKSRF